MAKASWFLVARTCIAGAALVALGGSVGCGGGADDPPPAPDAGPANVASFSFLRGDWVVTGTVVDDDGSERAVEAMARIAGDTSSALKEQLVGTRGAAAFEVRAVYGPSDQPGAWILARGDGERGVFDVLEGNAEGQSLRVQSREGSRPDGGATRMTFTVDGADAVSVRVEDSADGEQTWELREDLSYRRVDSVSLDPPAQAVGCDGPAYRSFDFWQGDWAAGQSQNDLRLLLGGCILEENWRGAVRGSSFNMYDPRAGQWAQLWFDTGRNTLVTFGAPTASGMELRGPRGGVLERIVWTDNGDGTVRQVGQSSTDDGASWTLRYDILYQPR